MRTVMHGTIASIVNYASSWITNWHVWHTKSIIIGKEGEYPTSLWYCVTTLYGGHDLCNHIHKFEVSLLAVCSGVSKGVLRVLQHPPETQISRGPGTLHRRLYSHPRPGSKWSQAVKAKFWSWSSGQGRNRGQLRNDQRLSRWSMGVVNAG